MDAHGALVLVNAELQLRGRPPLLLNQLQLQKAFQSLQAYAATSGRPLEVAVKDMVRFQIQTEDLALRRQS